MYSSVDCEKATIRTLTLSEKIALIKDHANGIGLSQRKLAEKYKISKGAVGNILQRKDEYEKDFASNANKDSKRKLRHDGSHQLDKAVFSHGSVLSVLSLHF